VVVLHGDCNKQLDCFQLSSFDFAAYIG